MQTLQLHSICIRAALVTPAIYTNCININLVYLCINNYEVLSQYRELFLLLRMHRSMITLHVTMPKFTLNHAEPKSDN